MTAALVADRDRLRAALEKARAALEFYSRAAERDPLNDEARERWDYGNRADEALAAIDEVTRG